jgi:phosphatidylglycerophosphatase A
MSREPFAADSAIKSNWLDQIAWLLATGCGVGLTPKAPGTVGSLLGPLLVWSWQQQLQRPFYESVFAAVMAFLIGVAAADRTSKRSGLKDPGFIVCDEIVAFCIVFAATTVTWQIAILGFVWFRLFDIWKPWPIPRLERLPGGWGIMADDLLAGLYAALALQASTHLLESVL